MCLPVLEEEDFNIQLLFPDPIIEEDNDETLDIVEYLTAWQNCYYTNQLKFEAGILAADDQYIIDLYYNEFPNTLYCVLRLGCDYSVLKRMDRIEINYGATGLTVDPDTFMHIFGKYYKPIELDDQNKRFCLNCVRTHYTEDRNEINVYALHNYNDADTLLTNILSPLSEYKYWCYTCDRFLFDAEFDVEYTDPFCTVCISVIPHDPKYLSGNVEEYLTICQLPNNPRTIPLTYPGWPVQM